MFLEMLMETDSCQILHSTLEHYTPSHHTAVR